MATAKNVQKGARFNVKRNVKRESEARMLIRLTPPERGKMRASVIYNFKLLFLNCFKLRFNVWSVNNFNNTSLNLLEKKDRKSSITFPVFTTCSLAQAIISFLSDILGQRNDSSSCLKRNQYS